MVEYLMEEGADTTAKDQGRSTPADYLGFKAQYGDLTADEEQIIQRLEAGPRQVRKRVHKRVVEKDEAPSRDLLVREVSKMHLNAAETEAVIDLLKTKPLILYFPSGESAEDRQRKLNTLSPFDRELIAYIIHQYVAGYKNWAPEGEQWGLLPVDPLYYMATEDQDLSPSEIDWELRTASHDWRFIMYSKPDSPYRLVDFNGWPGDNESGIVGLIYKDTLIQLAINSDTWLDVNVDNVDVVKALEDYEAIREETFPS